MQRRYLILAALLAAALLALWVSLPPWRAPSGAAGSRWVHFQQAGQTYGDLWVDATRVEAVDSAYNGVTYSTRITIAGNRYFVVGSVNNAEAAIAAAAP